jgi:hypothetical protein
VEFGTARGLSDLNLLVETILFLEGCNERLNLRILMKGNFDVFKVLND